MVVPAALETAGEQVLSQVAAAQISNVNPFGNSKIELVVEPRLDAKSTANYWLFGDPALAPVLEYAYLEGQEGIQVDSQAGWDILGVDFRAVLDYGVGAVDWRGAYKSTGV